MALPREDHLLGVLGNAVDERRSFLLAQVHGKLIGLVLGVRADVTHEGADREVVELWRGILAVLGGTRAARWRLSPP